MKEIEIESQLEIFVDAVKEQQAVWALGDDEGGFVVSESNHHTDRDALLLWDDSAKAAAQANGEWENYSPLKLPLSEFMEFWVDTLSEDNLMIGINWSDEQVCVEIEPLGLVRALES